MADLVFGVSPQVREEACEKARSEWVAGGFDMSHADWELRPLVDAAIPVIAEAAVEGEREKTRLRIKAIVPYPSDGPGAEAVYRFKAKLLAAIDKEGVN